MENDESPEASAEDHPLGESEEMEWAAGLLEVTNAAELDGFLGRLLARVMNGAHAGPAGRALRQLLRQAALRAMPMLGGSAPASGAPRLATAAGDLFGLELEGLSPEDQEYETARRFVRFAGAGAWGARRFPRSTPPRVVASRALGAAARRHAPGFLRRRRPSRRRSPMPPPWNQPADRPTPPGSVPPRPYRYPTPYPYVVGPFPTLNLTPSADPEPPADPDPAPPSDAAADPGDASGNDGGDPPPSPDGPPADSGNPPPTTTQENDMHDLDRTTLEIADETSDFESSESDNEYSEMDPEGTFSEEEEAELAAELLEINSEEELDQFIGDLLKKAKSIVGGALKSPVLQPLGGLIKGAIKKALPVAGGALGNMLIPGLGGAVGSQLASKAGDLLGLEMENASPEDQEFDVAKRLVRLAGSAAQNAAQMPSASNAQQAAKEAMIAAAQLHAPGLLQPAQSTPPSHPHHHRAHRGHWYRHGNKIVLVGV